MYHPNLDGDVYWCAMPQSEVIPGNYDQCLEENTCSGKTDQLDNEQHTEYQIGCEFIGGIECITKNQISYYRL